MVDKQDLRNIQKAFGLDEVQRHSNDQDSVLAWITEWEEQENNPIIYYKLQGEKDEEGNLKEEDFMIVIQS